MECCFQRISAGVKDSFLGIVLKLFRYFSSLNTFHPSIKAALSNLSTTHSRSAQRAVPADRPAAPRRRKHVHPGEGKLRADAGLRQRGRKSEAGAELGGAAQSRDRPARAKSVQRRARAAGDQAGKGEFEWDTLLIFIQLLKKKKNRSYLK